MKKLFEIDKIDSLLCQEDESVLYFNENKNEDNEKLDMSLRSAVAGGGGGGK